MGLEVSLVLSLKHHASDEVLVNRFQLETNFTTVGAISST